MSNFEDQNWLQALNADMAERQARQAVEEEGAAELRSLWESQIADYNDKNRFIVSTLEDADFDRHGETIAPLVDLGRGPFPESRARQYAGFLANGARVAKNVLLTHGAQTTYDRTQTHILMGEHEQALQVDVQVGTGENPEIQATYLSRTGYVGVRVLPLIRNEELYRSDKLPHTLVALPLNRESVENKLMMAQWQGNLTADKTTPVADYLPVVAFDGRRFDDFSADYPLFLHKSLGDLLKQELGIDSD